MKDRHENVLKKVIETYGINAQLDMVVEECSELIKAICKYKRYKSNGMDIANILDEVADVQIMLNQIPLMFDKKCLNNLCAQDYIDLAIESKLDRLENRLEGED